MPRWIIGFVLSVLVLGGLWLLWARTGVNFANQQLMWQGGDAAAAGQWGDTFGAFNAFFGALGFAAIIVTLWIQSAALQEQSKDLHRQRFETTFFELLKMLREARDEVRFFHTPQYLQNNSSTTLRSEYQGHAAFRAAYREMRYWIGRDKLTVEKIEAEKLASIYVRRVHARYESTFGAYYRLLYTILHRINTDRFLSLAEKNSLGNLVRGQFTSFESCLAGCNGLASFSKDFDQLVLRFRLLKYARVGPVYDALRLHYADEAFRGREGEEPPPQDPDVVESEDR